MASMPFQLYPQEVVHGSQIHGMSLLQPLPISGGSIRKRASSRRHCVQPLSSRKMVPRVNAYTTSIQDMKPVTKPSPHGVSTQIPPLQDVVIVGGGIAGLATALALHRVGVKPVVLEQSERLRTAGATIGLWTNAWKALEVLGVADELRKKFIKLSGVEIITEDGNLIASLMLSDAPGNVELRAVERKTLLETLQEPLPDGAVFYDSHVVAIKRINGGYTEIQCENGLTLQTKVLIGCDGVGSVVAKYMNMGEPHYAGYAATRGLAVYPDGHNLGSKAIQMIGRGVRAGVAPIDANRTYWFVVFNAKDERVSDVKLVQEEALNLTKGCPSYIRDAVNRSSLETLSRRGISDRWMWPVGGPPLYNGCITLAGDAMHPMTPNLGQGGCCALEDAVILARKLSKALSTSSYSSSNGSLDDPMSQEMERIELSLKSYTEERWPRLLRLAIRSYLTGAFLQLDNELICSLRNKLLPKVINAKSFTDHTFYDCGTLQ